MKSPTVLHACPCGELFIGHRLDLFHSHDCQRRMTRKARTLTVYRENRATNLAIQARRGINETHSRPASAEIVEKLKGVLDGDR